MNRILRYTLGTLGLFVVLVAAAGAEFEELTGDRRIPIPEGVFYYQPLSTVHGSEAAWVNPAALAVGGAAGFQLMADYAEGEYLKSWGTVFQRDRIATGFRAIDNPSGENFEEWFLASGMSMGKALNFGISYRYFRNGPELYNNRHFWNIGLLSRGHGPFAMSALFSNINRSKVRGERSTTEQRYSIGYRPFGPRLTVAADMFLSTRHSVKEADFVYHAEYSPVNGLYVNATVDSDRNYGLGMRANLLRYFTGTRSSYSRQGDHHRTTVFVGATDQRQPTLIREPTRRLRLSVVAQPSENPPQPIFGRGSTPFVRLITTIYRAAEDPSVDEILLKLDRLHMGLGQAQELREALARFRQNGKRVICHVGAPNNIAYYIASVADQILIPPVSQLRLVGLRAELTFFAGSLEKLGVNLDILKVGAYKTAAETFTRRESSPENREQINRLLDDLYEQFVGDIAAGRGMTTTAIRELVDQGPFTSAEALAAGLVDGLAYSDEIKAPLVRKMPEIAFRSYQRDTLFTDSWHSEPVLAVVVAEGEITSDDGDIDPLGRAGGVTPSAMSRAFRHALANRAVKGIVFRINSPGGSALAGERIWHEVERAAKRKPIVVSMANSAASGGYYIGMPASRLFASPGTITGSIGIFGGKADLSGLYDKIDLTKELYTRGKFAGMLSTTRPFTEAERVKYQGSLDAFYDHFVSIVATNRTLPTDSVDQLGRGRVWTGQQAQANGLVDEIGGVRQSLEYLAERGGLVDYTVEIYPRKRPWIILPGRSLLGPLVKMLTGGRSDVVSAAGLSLLDEDESVLMRMPFDLDIQ